MSEYSRALGDTVRAARKKMGLSQNKVAALIDADERTIMNIETYNANTTINRYSLLLMDCNNLSEIFKPHASSQIWSFHELLIRQIHALKSISNQ